MSRRRRLALRQVAEPEMHVTLSDVDDELPMAEPNFNLLGMMQAVGTEAAPALSLSPPSSTQPLIYVDDDGDHDMDQASTQLVPSPNQNGGAEQPAKKLRVGIDQVAPRSATAAPLIPTTRAPTVPNGPASRGVFQLYQKGLCDDHTLRLHFIRRRPPPPPTRIEDDFVLPRPEISIFDMLPTRLTSVSDILGCSDDVPEQAGHIPPPTFPVDEVLPTATTHWRQLAAAPAELVAAWRGLQECDWLQVYERSGYFAPAPQDLVRLIETLRSDAFASFVWRELLIPTVQSLHRSNASPSEATHFTTALLNHEIFRRLPAKEFRAQLRAKNLRTSIPSDETMGFAAAMELNLVAQFHKFRNSGV